MKMADITKLLVEKGIVQYEVLKIDVIVERTRHGMITSIGDIMRKSQ